MPSASSNVPNGSSAVRRRLERVPGRELGIGVQREDRREVRPRRARQPEAVLLRAGVRALVRADRAGAVVLDAHAREEAVARERAPVGAGVVLHDRPEGGLVVLGDGACRSSRRRAGPPRGRSCRRRRGPPAGRCSRRCTASGRRARRAASGSMTSYGRRREILQRTRDAGVVVQGAERLDAGHRRWRVVDGQPRSVYGRRSVLALAEPVRSVIVARTFRLWRRRSVLRAGRAMQDGHLGRAAGGDRESLEPEPAAGGGDPHAAGAASGRRRTGDSQPRLARCRQAGGDERDLEPGRRRRWSAPSPRRRSAPSPADWDWPGSAGSPAARSSAR